VLGTLYKLLHPYMPFATENLWKHVGFEGILMQSAWPIPIQLSSKNYRVNLLMDIIAVWRALKGQLQQKSHEKVTLYVQANKDILDQVEEHQGLIKDILNVDEILYF
jgi:valyl-tRNA synthetase